MPTPLHITTNDGTGMIVPCGSTAPRTYRALTDGTAHRYIDRLFVTAQHLNDPALCSTCATLHAAAPPATVPTTGPRAALLASLGL